MGRSFRVATSILPVQRDGPWTYARQGGFFEDRPLANKMQFGDGKDAELECSGLRFHSPNRAFFVLERTPSGYPDEPFEYSFGADPLLNATYVQDSPFLETRIMLLRIAAPYIPGLTLDRISITASGFSSSVPVASKDGILKSRLTWNILIGEDEALGGAVQWPGGTIPQSEGVEIFRKSFEQVFERLEKD